LNEITVCFVNSYALPYAASSSTR